MILNNNSHMSYIGTTNMAAKFDNYVRETRDSSTVTAVRSEFPPRLGVYFASDHIIPLYTGYRSYWDSLLPAPGAFTSEDIGSPARAGKTVTTQSDILITCGGTDIWNGSDSFHFAHKPVAGNLDLVVKVDRVSDTNGRTKAGLMFREGTGATARHAFVYCRSDRQVDFQWRSETGASAVSSGVAGAVGAVKYLRLSRNGNVINAYYSTASADGPWTQVGGPKTVSMSGVRAGLAVSSRDNSKISAARFSGYRETAPHF